MIDQITLIGHPSYLGGADTEAAHQIRCWLNMGIQVHICPVHPPDEHALSLELDKLGCIYHTPADWKSLEGQHVISFCNREYLDHLGEIRLYARTTSWVNCVPADATICGIGMDKAKDVKVGDLVYGHDGHLHAVTNRIERRTTEDLVSVRTAGLPAVEVTANHRMLVYERDITSRPKYVRYAKNPVWKTADKVVPGDCLVAPKAQPNAVPNPEFPTDVYPQTRHRPKMAISKNVAWLFGAFVADGSATKNHKAIIALANADQARRAVSAFAELGVPATLKDYGTYWLISAYSATLANTFLTWFGCGSENKRLPAFLFNGKWDLASVLQGLCDGDGCVHRGEMRLSTVSHTLMLQSFQIAVSLGHRPTVYVQKRGKGAFANAKRLYVVRWVLDPQKTWKTRRRGDQYCLPVIEITKVPYDGIVVDFEVEGSHSFVCEGVAVHNCMTWPFPAEIRAQQENLIDLHLYQTPHARDKIGKSLDKNMPCRQRLFTPYFWAEEFPFHARRPDDKFRVGRLSREDPAKFNPWQLWVYENMTAPVLKEATIMGWGDKIASKFGNPKEIPHWVTVLPCLRITAQELYRRCDAIVMTTDTFENLPRVGFEAMASGSILVVDDRGGWRMQVEQGKTGWLCKDHREMSYRASRVAFEARERVEMAGQARDKLEREWGMSAAMDSWAQVFDELEKIR